jgi:amino acid transporter
MISVVSASLVVSYAVAPVSVAALRRSYPEMNRPFRVRALSVVGPLAFAVATLIIYWTGWQTLYWLLGGQVVLYVVYLIATRNRAIGYFTFSQQVRSSLWLVGYYLLTLIASYLGPFGGVGIVPHPYDFLMICAVSLIVYYWGAYSGAPGFREKSPNVANLHSCFAGRSRLSETAEGF